MTTNAPMIRVNNVRRIYDDGNHNAFTDMCRFQGRMYIAFRSSPESHHVVSGSRIVVLSSTDGHDWRESHAFSVAGRDVRDPHFLVFQDRLYVLSGTWLCDGKQDMADHEGYAVSTNDGKAWSQPQVLEGTHGYYIWRAAAFDGRAYLCAQWRRHVDVLGDPRGTLDGRTVLLESTDCITWKPVGLIETEMGNETAFLFEDDGEILAIVRNRKNALLCRAKPPYTEWSRFGLGRFVGGPMLARWSEHYLVGSRKIYGPEDHRTVLSWLIDDRLQDMVELPSGGDNSYTGFVPLGDTQGLISYYSSHEGSGNRNAPCHIYLANVSLHA